MCPFWKDANSKARHPFDAAQRERQLCLECSQRVLKVPALPEAVRHPPLRPPGRRQRTLEPTNWLGRNRKA